jgi:hypothetical protein
MNGFSGLTLFLPRPYLPAQIMIAWLPTEGVTGLLGAPEGGLFHE